MGTLLGWLRFRSPRRRGEPCRRPCAASSTSCSGAIVLLAALASLTLLVLDPIALLTRAMTTSLIPGFVYLVDARRTGGRDAGDRRPASSSGSRHAPRPRAADDTSHTTRRGSPSSSASLRSSFSACSPTASGAATSARSAALLGLVAKVQAAPPRGERRLRRLRRLRHAPAAWALSRSGVGTARQTGPQRQTPRSRRRQRRVVTSECTMCLDCLVACPSDAG